MLYLFRFLILLKSRRMQCHWNRSFVGNLAAAGFKNLHRFKKEASVMKVQFRNSLLLLLTAFIWGTAFVAQSVGMDYMGAFTFNGTRSLIGGAVLIPCIFLLRRFRAGKPGGGSSGGLFARNKTLVTGGICCGLALFVASNLQQFGLKQTPAGKAGFITALYIVLVPVFGLFLKRKTGKLVWIGMCFAVAGLYFLCINEKLTIGGSDLLVLACAVVFAVHILVIDHFAPLVDGVAMSCIQFFVCGILSTICALLFEEVHFQALMDCAGPLLYAGVMSCGVAYTLQIVGQANLNPTVASMLMSLESVFSVLAGLVVLHQMLSGREILGCVLMFVAVVLAQLPEPKRKSADSDEAGK